MDKLEYLINAYQKQGSKKTVFRTEFLSPDVLEEFKDYLKTKRSSDLKYFISYGFTKGERGRVVFYPDFFQFEEVKDNIQIIALEYQGGTLSHRDILGALMSLGFKREVLGDILVSDGSARIAILDHFAEYLKLNLEKIGSLRVSIKECADLKPLEQDLKEINVTLSSLRLDGILSKGFGLSRSSSGKLISGKKVKVNFRIIEKIDRQIMEGDLISCHGFGRLKVLALLGKNHKERYKVCLGMFI